MQLNQLFVEFYICSRILAHNILAHELVVHNISFMKQLVVSFEFNQRDYINNLEFWGNVKSLCNFLELSLLQIANY